MSLLLLALGIILAVFASPLSPIYKPGNYEYFRDYGISTPSSMENKVDVISRSIPNGALVITTVTIFPHLSTNLNAYTIPNKFALSSNLYDEDFEYLKNIKYDYIFYTYFWDRDVSDTLYKEFVNGNSSYGLFVEGPGLELYKYGYSGTPTKIALRFSSNELSFSNMSTVAEDSSSESGNVILYNPSSVANGIAWFGPYITLVPGNYTANFRIKFDSIPNGRAIVLDVSSNLGVNEIAWLKIYGSNITRPLVWYTFSIPFSVGVRSPNVEFRGLDVAANVGLSLDNIEVVPL